VSAYDDARQCAGSKRNLPRLATKARATIPILRFQPPRHQNGWSASITGSDRFFHRIEGMADFYAALGLRHEMSGGLPPEEYIWDRYIRDSAPMSRKCVHDLYVFYLHAHSAEFKKLYGDAYEEMMGKCS
jgi:hypothetical protein